MSSVIPKLFHKILAKRLESYLLDNDIINPSVQKGFLTGINGVAEHIFRTFLDLQNAFGSVNHALILDILSYIKVINALVTYISNAYSNLTASVKTKEWKIPVF